MSLQAMTDAVGHVMTKANRGASLEQVSEAILFQLLDSGYELKAVVDTGLSPMTQGAIELHEVFSVLQEQGFTEEQAFELTKRIFDTNLEMFKERN